jgi:acyl dehydratase
MELTSSFVGTPLKPYRVEISWRQMMNYAAAVQDDNPVYFSDQAEGGVIGHPMLTVAVTWPLLQNLAGSLTTEDFPLEILPTQVHYTECLMFFRPVRPGDRLTIKGKVAAIYPHRSGTHMVIRLEAVDAWDRPVFTEYAGALLRGVNCRGDGRGIETLPSTPECPHKKRVLWEKRIFIDPLQTFLYDGCTNIFFPIHTSVKFAQKVGLPGIILQGTATLAHAVRELINEEADRQPTRLQRISCRFTHMVFPGTEIRVQLRDAISRGREKTLFFVVLNSRGEKAISNGYAVMENEDS